jgi:septal ring factor EnvC (AmiA/AmiB activator)
METLDVYKRLLGMRIEQRDTTKESIPKIEHELEKALSKEALLAERDVSPTTLKEARMDIHDLDSELKQKKSFLDHHESEIRKLEKKINEIMDPNTIQSANLIRMASQRRDQGENSKSPKLALHPLHRLRAHGPHFYEQFMKNIEGNADVPGALHRSGLTLKHNALGGKRKHKKTLKRRRMSTSCPKPTRYMAV